MNVREKLLLKLHQYFPLLSKGTGIIMLNNMLGRSILSTTAQIESLIEQGLIIETDPKYVCYLTDLGKQEVEKFTFKDIAAELFGDEVPKGYLFFIDAEEDRNMKESFDMKNIQSMDKAVEYYSSRPENSYFKIRLKEVKENLLPITNMRNQTTELRELSTCRPLLIREQIELRFLQKIQAADTLESLQSIENEVISLATDETLKVQLVKCVEAKKRFC